MEQIAGGIIQTDQGSQLSLDPEFVRQFVSELNEQAAQLLQETNRLGEAEPLMRRALAIGRWLPRNISGIGGTLIGFLFAFTAARCRLPRPVLTAIDAAVLLPLVSPPFTTAIAMIFSFGPRGLITYELLGLKGVTVYGLTSTLFSEALTVARARTPITPAPATKRVAGCW